MIVIFAALLGLFIGGITAKRRNGNRKDIAQYAFGYAFAFMIPGMILTVLLDRLFF